MVEAFVSPLFPKYASESLGNHLDGQSSCSLAILRFRRKEINRAENVWVVIKKCIYKSITYPIWISVKGIFVESKGFFPRCKTFYFSQIISKSSSSLTLSTRTSAKNELLQCFVLLFNRILLITLSGRDNTVSGLRNPEQQRWLVFELNSFVKLNFAP